MRTATVPFPGKSATDAFWEEIVSRGRAACYNRFVVAGPLPSVPPIPNPVTQAAFRRQVRLEVYLPLGLIILLIVILGTAAVVVAWGTASSWADTVIVLLAVPMAVALLIVLAGLVAASVGLIAAIRRIPEVTVGLQDGVVRVSEGVRQGSDATAKVVIIPNAVAGAIGEASRLIRSLFRSGLR